MKVNKNTRAGKNGTCLACPKCGRKVIVYRFVWPASPCGERQGDAYHGFSWVGCGEIIEKNDWLVIG